MRFFRRNILFVIVFLTGAAVLIIEIAAVRILSPYFGNTLFTFSSIIGVILGALSVGYYAGGVLADRRPRYSIFFLIILLSGLVTIFIQTLAKTALPALDLLFSVKTGPVVSSMLLFFVPGFLLGMMSPFAIKLKSMEQEGIGRVSGSIFFWSTIGSIAGSFSAGFFFIPRVGISTLIPSVGMFLFLMGAVGFLWARRNEGIRAFVASGAMLTLLFAASLGLIFLSRPGKSSAVYEKDGLYSKITVEDLVYQTFRVRLLKLDGAWESGIVIEGFDELPFEYTRYYRIYEVVNPGAKNALFLGGGAYTTPRRLLLDKNKIQRVDVAEIEPVLYDLAKRYFRLGDDPRLFNHITDGRRFLRETGRAYDIIFGDVYYTIESIPVHFTTQDFFALAKEKLTDRGIYLMNVIGTLDPKGAPFLLSEIKTFRSVFSNSYFFAVVSPDSKKPQNFIFLGIKDENRKLNFSSAEILEHPHPVIRELGEKLVDIEKLDFKDALLLTDDYAPVEYLVSKFLR